MVEFEELIELGLLCELCVLKDVREEPLDEELIEDSVLAEDAVDSEDSVLEDEELLELLVLAELLEL